MGSEPSGNSSPSGGVWVGIALFAGVAAIAVLSDDGRADLISTQPVAGTSPPDFRATCLVPSVGAARLAADQFGAPPASCRVGGEIQLAVQHEEKSVMYAHVAAFAHGTVASQVWPMAAGGRAHPVAASRNPRPLPFRFRLNQRGATVVAILADRPLSEQEIRAYGRQASSERRVHGAHVGVFRIEASGIRLPAKPSSGN